MSTAGRCARLAGALLLLAGCGRQAGPPPASSADAGAPAAQRTRIADGAPRVVLAPDGVHIDYRVYGQGEPLVVLIHGWSGDANYWRAQVADLSRSYTVVTPNLAGHGASGRNRTNWSIEAFGGDIAAVLAELPEGPVVLVGHAMGGPVALEAARRVATRVIGIVGVEAFDDIGAPRRPGAEAAAAARIARLREDYIGTVRDLVPQQYFTPGANPAFARSIADDIALAPPEVAIASLMALDQYDYGPALAALPAPLVAILSSLRGAPDIARIRTQVPGFRAEIMRGRGHFLMVEDPAGFNALLRREIDAFVAATPAAGTAQ